MQVVGSLQEEKNKDICDTTTCVPQIYDAIYQATVSSQKAPSTSSQRTNTADEYYVALGSGSNSTSDWADVGGASAYVDSSKYGHIQKVTFEASVIIPTGNQTAYARLFNKTDQHPVWFSDVSLQGGQAQLLISSPITLDSGQKLYQVQMKTQLQFPANLTQSRIHILTSN